MFWVAEADAIMLTEKAVRIEKTVKNECVKYDHYLDGRSVRVAHLYTKIYELICGCFRACGLPTFSVSDS